MSEAVASAVRLAAITDAQLDVDRVLAAVRHPGAGGTAVFVGTVRDHDHGHDVAGLEYTAHPSAEAQLAEVAAAIASEHDVLAVAAEHRVGPLVVGDVAVVVAVASVHRAEAFVACHALIDRLKAEVAIWKHQRFTDGTDEWVGTP